MDNIDFLYIAEGKLHLKLVGAPFRIISSEFGKATQERILQIRRKNIFANQGMMANQIPPQMLKQMDEQANTLVYQSAGIARNNKGFVLDRSPFRIEKLDFIAQDVTCLAEDKNYDFLEPQMTSDGTLFYIRRPYNSQFQAISIWTVIKDILLLPFRIANTIYQIANFFAVTFTGKPLMKVGQVQPSETQKMKVWDHLIDLQKLPKDKNRKEGDAPSLVPNSWQLICQKTDGTETVIAEGVLYYDLKNDGSIIYTNGNNIYSLTELSEKPKKILAHKLVEHLAIASC